MKRTRSEQGKRRVEYFVPGEVLLLVEPPGRIDPDDTQQLIDGIRQKSYAGDRLSTARADPKRVLVFDHVVSDRSASTARTVEQQAPRNRFLPDDRPGQAYDVRDLRRAAQEQFALVPFQFADDNQEPQELTALIDELNRGIRGELAQLIGDGGVLPAGEFLVRGAAPNWLAGPTQHWGSVAGPGARPAPASEDDWKIELLSMPEVTGKSGGEGVDVAILDTAPSKEQLSKAYDTWVANQKQPHPLLQSLLDNGGAFDVGPDSRLELITSGELGVGLPDPGALRVRDHDYPMSDHGLFAAGIINSIAPNAHLLLFEVLNAYGIGTLESIGRALQRLLEERKAGSSRPLVVNMSLTLAMPLEGHPRPDFGWTILAEDAPLLSLSLEWICAALRSSSVSLVAAAGNDADEPDAWTTTGLAPAVRRRGTRPRMLKANKRPQARYPAAFPTVLGVGALLEGSDEPAEYSNWADEPDGAGVWTFGGKAVDDDVDPGSGMLGVYIGEFPTELDPSSHGGETYKTEPSTAGWGWWAGTSFAAPVISGTLAALAGQGGTPNLQAAETAFGGTLTSSTIGGIFPAKQGGS